MRRGTAPRIILNEHGQIMGISTGADACQEHNTGYEPLQHAITILHPGMDDPIVAALRAGEHVNTPHIIERNRIVKNLDQFQYSENTSDLEAMLWYGDQDLPAITEELHFSGKDRAGAWDHKSFGFRVRGMQVMQLKDLHRQIMLGNTCFASDFIFNDGERCLDGITIMIVDRLYPKYQAAVTLAQGSYISKLRLKGASREDELRRIFYENGAIPGFIWPMWKDAEETEVVYGFNPGRGMMADYYGPYTFTELKEWAEAGFTYHLKPSIKEEAA